MKRLFLLLSWAILSSSVSAIASTPALCPEPKMHNISQTEFIPFNMVSIVCPDDSALSWAKKHLKQWYGKFTPEVISLKGDTSSMDKEEYRIKIGNKGTFIEANTLQGVRYALYTMRQLAIPKRNTEKVEGWIVPYGVIEDKPDMEFRGMHICWFHENQAWEIERMIRLAAYYKLNYAVIEPWGTFQSKTAPWFGWKDGKMTYKEIKRLKAIADDLGITLIPQLNIFGHASNARVAGGKHATIDLKPKYQPYFEPLAGWNWCLTNPNTKILQKKLIKELYDAFGCPPYFHIGCDEASVPSCPNCIEKSYATLFGEHIIEMSEYIKSLGARTLMWHDKLIQYGDPRWKGTHAKGTKETASVLHKLPKDIIICDWYYRKPLKQYNTLEHFNSLGFDVLACPWDKKAGTVSFISAAHKIGIKGVLGTLWHHYFSNSFNTVYYYVSTMAWNKDSSMDVFGSAYNNRYAVHTHLRQIGWDMKNRDPRRTGTCYDEMAPEPHL